MEIRTGAVIVAALVLAGCGSPEPEHPIIRKPGVVVKCSDFTSGQEVFAAEQQGELIPADIANLDADGDGIPCNESGKKFKDTRTHVEGLPPYEVAFVVDGNIPGVKAGEVTIDVSTDMKPAKPSQFLQREPLLEVIGWEAMKQVGVGTKTGYEAAEITFRNKDYKEIGLGFYVANQRAADIVNRYMREERGWKVDYFGGEVPQGGVVTAYRL